MEALFAEYLKILEQLHAEMQKAMEGLPQEALDWAPGAEMNSMSVIATHTAGSERFLIGDIAAGTLQPRDRAAEFRAQGVDAATLAARLAASREYVREVLDRFTLEGLKAPRTFRDGRKVTVAWAVLHLLDHTGMHVGHMQLTRQLWEQKGR